MDVGKLLFKILEGTKICNILYSRLLVDDYTLSKACYMLRPHNIVWEYKTMLYVSLPWAVSFLFRNFYIGVLLLYDVHGGFEFTFF